MFPYRIYSFLKILFFILTVHSLLTRKKSIKFCIVAFILNTLFVFLNGIYFSEHIANEGTVKVITYFLSFSYLVYLTLVFEESLSKKIFTFFSICMFSTITLFIATPSAELVSNIYDVNYTQNLIYILRNSINLLFLLASYFWIGKNYKTILNLVSDKTINCMSSYQIIRFFIADY